MTRKMVGANFFAVAGLLIVFSAACSKPQTADEKAKSQIAHLRAQAEQGKPAAQYDLAEMYAGPGLSDWGEKPGAGLEAIVPHSDAAAVAWYRKAAEQGHSGAQFALGQMYQWGRGVPQNDEQALMWIHKAAKQGDAEAQLSLGLRYGEGSGVLKDDAQAIVWIRKAAEQKFARAQLHLGVLYGEGRGVPQDDAQSVRWVRKAAEQGYAKAQLHLGTVYWEGRGVPQDYEQAVSWFRKAAEPREIFDVRFRRLLGDLLHEEGDAGAMLNLGLSYESGKGVSKDLEQAAAWYRKAAESGNGPAMYGLGLLYASGRGVPKDDEEATKWILKAAEQGVWQAQLAAAKHIMWLRSRSYPFKSGSVESLKWLFLAATLADTEAGKKETASSRDSCASDMRPSEIEEAQKLAQEWLEAFKRR